MVRPGTFHTRSSLAPQISSVINSLERVSKQNRSNIWRVDRLTCQSPVFPPALLSNQFRDIIMATQARVRRLDIASPDTRQVPQTHSSDKPKEEKSDSRCPPIVSLAEEARCNADPLEVSSHTRATPLSRNSKFNDNRLDLCLDVRSLMRADAGRRKMVNVVVRQSQRNG
jgi:hypothetical protein